MKLKESETSEWVNSYVCVKKPNGSIRACIDPRPLNKAVIRLVHRSKTLDEILPELARSCFFSKFDCTKGFWNIKLDYQSSLLTTTAFPEFHARWTRLGMGLKSSSDIFQVTIDKHLKGLLSAICIADDIIVHGNTEQEHNDHMYALFNRLLKINMWMNPKKAVFCCTHIPFFGTTIDSDGLIPDPNKVKSIKDWKTPTCVAEVQSFLGLVNYLLRFIPNLATLHKPLQDLCKSNVLFNWSPNIEQAFQNIKNVITDDVKLLFYDESLPLIIESDASGLGLDSGMLQPVMEKDGELAPIYFHSKNI